MKHPSPATLNQMPFLSTFNFFASELVVTHTDSLQVFNNLQSASLNSHLPAFQTCQ